MWPFLILPVIAILSFIYGPKALNKYKRATDREEKNKQLIITIVLLSAGIISSIILLGVIITGIVLSNYRPWKLVDFRQENTLRSVQPKTTAPNLSLSHPNPAQSIPNPRPYESYGYYMDPKIYNNNL
jgi:hypothetical protein